MIKTHYVYPPIPIRTMDWQATSDSYDGGDPIGHGETELEAVKDLCEQFEQLQLESDANELLAALKEAAEFIRLSIVAGQSGKAAPAPYVIDGIVCAAIKRAEKVHKEQAEND